eukprot:jgi/Psemu1/13745/gm1.13745_g
MTKKKDYTVLKDHLDEIQLKPISVPTSVDVYEFKKTLTNALAGVASIKYIQGGGYAFLLETEAQYRARDQNSLYPTAPGEPRELDSWIKLTSDTYKLWKRSRALYVEWNKYDREALLITDKKFPTMLDNLKDPGSKALPRGTTALAAFQAMEADLCSTDAQHQLTRELTKKMNKLSYTPVPISPKEYFRQLTKYQHQISLLPETANVTPAQMIDYSREVFTCSKHDPITLHRIDEDWKQYRETIAKGAEFSATANMVDIQNDQRFTELESKQRDLANICHEIYSQVAVSTATTSTATAASSMRMSHQWDTAMAALQADVNQLKAADASRPQQNETLSHAGRDCFKRRNKANHQEGATLKRIHRPDQLPASTLKDAKEAVACGALEYNPWIGIEERGRRDQRTEQDGRLHRVSRSSKQAREKRLDDSAERIAQNDVSQKIEPQVFCGETDWKEQIAKIICPQEGTDCEEHLPARKRKSKDMRTPNLEDRTIAKIQKGKENTKILRKQYFTTEIQNEQIPRKDRKAHNLKL